MRWCRDCGGYIEFRDAHRRALDLPECCCIEEPTPNLAADDVRAGFCQLTSCTVCGAPAFFIRHVEGRIWLDDLAYPWPKHKCFNSPLHAILPELNASRFPQLGIVLSANRAGEVKIRLQSGREVDYVLIRQGTEQSRCGGFYTKLPGPDLVRTLLVVDDATQEIIYPHNLVGALAYVPSLGDSKIVRHATHPLPGTGHTNLRGVPVITCEFCAETFSSEEEKGAHLISHPDWPCPFCSYTTLIAEELDSHLKTRHPARVD